MPRYDDRYSTRLYVGHLSSRTRSRVLEDLFSRYGRLAKLFLQMSIRNQRMGRGLLLFLIYLLMMFAVSTQWSAADGMLPISTASILARNSCFRMPWNERISGDFLRYPFSLVPIEEVELNGSKFLIGLFVYSFFVQVKFVITISLYILKCSKICRCADGDNTLPTPLIKLASTFHLLELQTHTYYNHGTHDSFICSDVITDDSLFEGVGSDDQSSNNNSEIGSVSGQDVQHEQTNEAADNTTKGK